MTDILQAFVIKKEAGTEQRFKSKLFFFKQWTSSVTTDCCLLFPLFLLQRSLGVGTHFQSAQEESRSSSND